MNDQSCELSHFHGQFHDSDCMAKACGTRPAGFLSTIISLILAQVGSTEKPRQSTNALKLKLWISPNSTVGREEYVGGHPLGAESALKAFKGGRFEAADKQPATMVELKSKTAQRITFSLLASPPRAGVDVSCSTMPWHEIL
jgi:hypothetical protein